MLKRILVVAQLALMSVIVSAAPVQPVTLPQTITGFAPATPLTYSAGLTFALSATGGASGNPVVFTSNSPAICTVSGTTATVLTPGNCSITANQAGKALPTATVLAATPVTVSVVINQGLKAQTITFGALGGKTLGAAAFGVSATASSGLAVAFTSATPSICMVSGSTVSLIVAGTCTIDANQGGNGSYAVAPQVAESFVVAPTVAPVCTIAASPSTIVGTGSTTLTASCTGTATAYTWTINCANPPFATTTANSISVSPTATTEYCVQSWNVNAANAPVATTVTVKAAQTISFPAIPAQTTGASLTLSATSSSGLAVTYASATPTICSVSSSTATMSAAGTCLITANQLGNGTYGAAPQVTQSIAVNAPLVAPVCSISASPSTIVGTGSTTLTASCTGTATGYTWTVNCANPPFATTTTNSISVSPAVTTEYCVQGWNVSAANAPVATTVTVKAAQTISFPAIPAQTTGASLTLSATSSSGLAVTYTSATPTICSVSGSTATMSTAGTCLITANQIGNGTYGAASPVTQSITVNAPLVAPTCSIAASPSTIAGGSSTTLTASCQGTTTEYTWSVNCANPPFATTTANSISVSPTATTEYCVQGWNASAANAPVSTTVTVTLGSQTISFPTIPAHTAGTSFSLSATSSANLPVTFASTTTAVCTVSGSTVTLSTAGTCTITASQIGNGSYTAAQQVMQSFAVGSAGASNAVVTLSATNSNVRITSGTTAAVIFNGGASATGGSIASLSLSQNTGSGPTTVWSGTGANIAQTLNLSAGSYVFVLTATDGQGNTAASAPIVVNVTNSSLLGQVNGVEITNAGTPQLFGWVCQGGNASGLSYSVYVNAPASLGGTLLTSGTANVSGQADDATVQTTCGTTGSSHDFTVNLSSFTSLQAGAPIYVQAQDSKGDSIVLPCSDNTCIMPGSMRIGLTSPSPTNTDQYSAPATLFVRSILTQGTAPYPPVSFKITGTLTGGGTFTTQTLSGVADTAAGAYYATLPNLAAGVYTVTSFVQQGNDILYSMPNIVTVVPGTGSTITLTSPTTGMQTTPVTLSATVAGTAVAGATVQFYENGVAIPGSTVTPSAGIATYNWVSATSGNYLITARLFNGSGTAMAWSTPTEINVSGSSGNTGGAIVPIASTAPIPVSSISLPNTGNPDAGTLPGAISVSNSGAATYSIPITVPPGTAGMTPSLSLNYSSQGGNGMMGVGWSVGGLSSIHRCHKTLAQDGISGGTQGSVSFDQTDRLCLDGQRLVLSTGLDVDAGYWTIGATYSTEIADFSRITMIAGPNGQPAFTVETKSGHIMYYGTNPGGDTTSFITAQGRGDGQALVWALGRVQDLNGNYYSISYSDDASATGEYLPQQISYGGNVTAGQAPDLLVDFCYTYGTRPDKAPRFAGGSHNDMISLLTSVLAFTNTSGSCTSGSQVRELDINYTTSASSGRELVNSVQAKALDPNSTSTTYNQLVPLPPTVFNWGQGQAPTFEQYNTATWPNDVAVIPQGKTGTPIPGPKPGNIIWADLNGDGLMDAIVPMDTANGQAVPAVSSTVVTAFNIYIAQPGGSYAAPVLWTIPSNLPKNSFNPAGDVADWGFTGDFNGDGSTDFYFMGGVVCLSQLKNVSLTNGNPSSWFSCSNWDTNNVLARVLSSDYLTLNTTGSGRDDIITQSGTALDPTAGTRCVSVPTAVGSASPYLFQCGSYNLGSVFDIGGMNRVGDFNGDGRQDIYRAQVVLNDAGTAPIGYQAVVCLSEDDGFHCSNWGGTQAILLPFEGMAYGSSLAESHSSQIVDLNGDGLADIWFGNTVCYSTGMAPTPGTPLVPNTSGGFNCQTLAAGPNLSSSVTPPVVTQGASMTQVGMVDGDGSAKQIVYTANTTTTPNTASWQLCTPYTCQPITGAPGPSVITGIPFFNNYLNDGNVDLGVYNYTGDNLGTWAMYGLSQSASAPDMDRIVTVTNGNGQVSQVDYLNGGNASVYSQYTATKGPSNFSYPQRSVTNPGYLVTDHKEADGQGGWLEQQYTYSAQAIDQSGRGSLGFASNTVLQTQTGVLAANQYRQDWPYSGMVLSSTSTETLSSSNPDGSTNSSGVLLSSGSNTLSLTPVVAGNQAIEAWGSSLAPCAICFPNISAATVTHQDLGGQDLGTSNTTTSYDNYGNVTNSTVVSGPTSNQSVVAEFSAQTVSTYDNNNGLCIAAHGNSYLSRICTTSVTKTNGSNAPGGTASITRSSASTYDGNGQLLTQTIEPGLPLQVVTSYIRDTYGNAKSQTQSWTAPAATAIQPNAPTGSMSRMTQTVFDGKGRFPTQYINALNLSSYPTFYPATGAKLSLKDANNLTTNWTADGFGRELTQTTPDQNQTVSYRKQCGTNANSTATTNESNCPANAVVMLATDHLNNGQRTSVPDVSYLDSLGHVLRKQDWGFDGSPIYVDNTYDTLGHLISTTWPYYDGINAPVQASAKHYDLVGRQDEEAHPSWNGLLQTANPARCRPPSAATAMPARTPGLSTAA